MKERSGISIVELLVAIVIISLLIGLLLPALSAVRESSRRLSCANNVQQTMLALHQHHNLNRQFPAGITSQDGDYPYLAWSARILPFIERGTLWSHIKSDYRRTGTPFGTEAHRGISTPISIYSCPSNGAAEKVHFARNRRIVALTDYLGVTGTDFKQRNGVFFRDSHIRIRDIRDGTSNTLCVGERPPSFDHWFGWWYAGVGQQASGVPDMLLGVNEKNIGYDFFGGCPPISRMGSADPEDPCSVLQFWSYHPGGTTFGFCDSSVRFIKYDIDLQVLRSLSTRRED